jgi:hypothetical protein
VLVGTILAAAFTLTLAVLNSASVDASSVNGGKNAHGDTAAFMNGRTVTLQYQRDFYCDPSVAQSAVTKCEAGQPNGSQPPKPGDLPDLFVAVPYGFTPAQGTQCPAATASSSCVDHPQYIDLSTYLSPYFGTSAQNAFLPAHDHVVTEKQGGWWAVSVYAVTSQQAWDQMVAGKSKDALDTLVHNGQALGPIPTNLNLFFNVVEGADPHPNTDVEAR